MKENNLNCLLATENLNLQKVHPLQKKEQNAKFVVDIFLFNLMNNFLVLFSVL